MGPLGDRQMRIYPPPNGHKPETQLFSRPWRVQGHLPIALRGIVSFSELKIEALHPLYETGVRRLRSIETQEIRPISRNGDGSGTA